MSDREPRIDPRPGDVLDDALDGPEGYTRVVAFDSAVVRYSWAGHVLTSDLVWWREDMDGAAVIKVAA